MTKRFLVAPMTGGVQTDLKPWMISDQAYENLVNCFEWRGRIKKRFGTLHTEGDSSVTQFNSRMRTLLGTTDGSGNLGSTNLPLNTGDMAVGMQFSIGDNCYTITALGNPATVLSTDGATLTVDTTASPATLTVSGADATTNVYFYPVLPIMGIYQLPSNSYVDEETVVYDTRFAYTHSSAGWSRLGTAQWTGGNTNFISAAAFFGAARNTPIHFVVNNNPADQIWYYNIVTASWTQTTFNINSGGDTVDAARLVIEFQGRLLLLGTYETISATQSFFPSTIRWCAAGDPFNTNSWYETSGTETGGYINIFNRDNIVSAQKLKNRLIIYCEDSTWELVSTGNNSNPFILQQIDDALGAISPFSTVVMDNFIFGIGRKGIHACNATQVERIDDAIPDTMWELILLNDSNLRVTGIRDFFTETIYWTIKQATFADSLTTYPTRVLVYNYKTGSYAFFDDIITNFGYYQTPSSATTWAATSSQWRNVGTTWSQIGVSIFNDSILIGNQQGFVAILLRDRTRNADMLTITDIDISSPNQIEFTSPSHNLTIQNYVTFNNIMGTGTISDINDKVYSVASVTANTFTIDWDTGTFPTGTYTGCGTVQLISPITIKTKEYNFFNQEGRNISLDKVDFNVDIRGVDVNATIRANYFSSFSGNNLTDAAEDTSSIVGTNNLNYFNETGDVGVQAWHSMYPMVSGTVVQLELQHTLEQMRAGATYSDFQLNGVMYYARPTDARFGN